MKEAKQKTKRIAITIALALMFISVAHVVRRGNESIRENRSRVRVIAVQVA